MFGVAGVLSALGFIAEMTYDFVSKRRDYNERAAV